LRQPLVRPTVDYCAYSHARHRQVRDMPLTWVTLGFNALMLLLILVSGVARSGFGLWLGVFGRLGLLIGDVILIFFAFAEWSRRRRHLARVGQVIGASLIAALTVAVFTWGVWVERALRSWQAEFGPVAHWWTPIAWSIGVPFLAGGLWVAWRAGTGHWTFRRRPGQRPPANLGEMSRTGPRVQD